MASIFDSKAGILAIRPKSPTNTSAQSHILDEPNKNKDTPQSTDKSKVSGDKSKVPRGKTPTIDLTQKFLSEQKAFHTADTLKSLATIGKYEELGIKSDLQPPRIILVGHPSCGKTRLVEKLTGLSFPASFRTRFPIEIVLRGNAQSVQIIPKIVLDPAAPKPFSSDPEMLNTMLGGCIYNEEMTLRQLVALLEKASEIFGIPSSPFLRRMNLGSSHMLQINVSGPGFQNLNIIDTPGFFPLSKLLFSGSAVENLVCSLMRDERNIILPVTSLTDSWQTVEHLKMMEMEVESDKRQIRTLRALTGCDKIATADSFLISLNTTFKHESTGHKCYMLNEDLTSGVEGAQSVNTNFEEGRGAFDVQSNANSRAGDLKLGQAALQTDLSNLYDTQLRQDLLLIQQKAQMRLNEDKSQLVKLDSQLVIFQRERLQTIVEEYQKYKLRSMEFGQSAQIQDSTLQLLIYQKLAVQKKTMLRDALMTRGGKRAFGDASADREILTTPSGMERSVESEGEIYTWILKRHREAKACSIPGLVAPALLESLFREQTNKWEEITELFLDTIENSFAAAVYHCLEKACHDKGVAEGLAALLYDVVKAKVKLLRTRCGELIGNERQGLELISNEESFIREVREAKTSRFISALANLEGGANRIRGRGHSPSPSIFSSHAAQSPSFKSKLLYTDTGLKATEPPKTPTRSPRTSFSEINTPPATRSNTPNFATLSSNSQPQQEGRTLTDLIRINRDQVGGILSSEKQLVFEIHDILKAYYNISLQHYVDVVCKNEINHKFVSEMMDVFSNEFIGGLSGAAVSKIFAGSEGQQKTRALVAEIKSLEEVIAKSEACLKEKAEKAEKVEKVEKTEEGEKR